MTGETFRDLLARRPFQAFRVVMSSGEKYEVRHPEMAFLSRTTLYVSRSFDAQGIPEDPTMCSLLHITNVEPLSLNGQKRRPRRSKK